MKSKSVRIEGKGSQFCSYIEHGTLGVHTLRVTIRLGGYKDQSWGKVERWDGHQWNEVVTIDGRALRVDPAAGYNYKRDLSPETFSFDRDSLIKLAKEVLA